mmetsp:Transcript_62/g.67  ORF Transcript_62/g.67 Transcript_62/m.67 type:complete len:107 (-) Transcript_62:18-338(-)
MKTSFIVQDKVISSLKEGQDAMDVKLINISNQVTTQMHVMNNVMAQVQSMMIGLVGRKPTLSKFEQQQRAIAKLSDDGNFIGNQPVLLGGSLINEILQGDTEKRGE